MRRATKEQAKLLLAAEAEVASHQAEVGRQLAEAIAERDKAAEGVPIAVRLTFDRLADSYDGEAMASVTEVNRRTMEYNCDGCYMTIPVEVVNALYMKPDDSTACPHCSRLLFLDEELKTTMGRKD